MTWQPKLPTTEVLDCTDGGGNIVLCIKNITASRWNMVSSASRETTVLLLILWNAIRSVVELLHAEDKHLNILPLRHHSERLDLLLYFRSLSKRFSLCHCGIQNSLSVAMLFHVDVCLWITSIMNTLGLCCQKSTSFVVFCTAQNQWDDFSCAPVCLPSFLYPWTPRCDESSFLYFFGPIIWHCAELWTNADEGWISK